MADVDAAREYVRDNLKLITRDMPADNKFARLHRIYSQLEWMGFNTRECRVIIDSVILENMNAAAAKLRGVQNDDR